MNRKIPELSELSAPTGEEYVNYISGSIDRNIKLEDLANTISGDGVLYYKQRLLTAAEIDSLHTTPVEIIAAPGANKIIAVRQLVTTTDGVGTPYSFGIVDRFSIRYTSGATYANSILAFLRTATPKCAYVLPSDVTAALENAALEAFSSHNFENGTMTCKIHVWYFIVSI